MLWIVPEQHQHCLCFYLVAECEDNVFNFDGTCSQLCSVHPLQDAFDALGYFQLALAAALEDQANPEALYVVYMKLAEIHGNHMPDAQLCQVYRDRARSLKGVLAGEGGVAVGEESVDDAVTEPGRKGEKDSGAGVKCAESFFTSSPENEKCEEHSFPRTCIMHGDAEDACTDTNKGDTNRKEDHSINLPDTEGTFVDATGSETETIASQSYSDSIFTESFDTAKEQISDSSSSTDTLQTYHNQSDGKDFDTAHGVPAPVAVNHTSDITRHTDSQNTDSDIQDEQNTPAKEKDVDQSDAGQAERL